MLLLLLLLLFCFALGVGERGTQVLLVFVVREVHVANIFGSRGVPFEYDSWDDWLIWGAVVVAVG